MMKGSVLSLAPSGGEPAHQAPRAIACCRLAEELGFDAFWRLADGPASRAIALAALARETNRIRLVALLRPGEAPPGETLAADLALASAYGGGRVLWSAPDPAARPPQAVPLPAILPVHVAASAAEADRLLALAGEQPLLSQFGAEPALFGNVIGVAEALQRRGGADFPDLLLAMDLPGLSLGQVLQSMQLFAEQVAPRLRAPAATGS